ncbi:response regulator transcription factor [Paenibacillus sp. FJAT-27812]|uniref:response regulator transcription factor n=1 Tax=Paenibacillus sp. FJAT-27812 TaxID=1684143 RepID=UPI0006A782B9|nr:response regulator [Paenibacillus sp. FJAT-27812]
MINALIVDDESIVRKGLRMMLPWDRFGIQIIGEAPNAEKALDIMKDRQIDLLFTDITMPGMNGLKLLERVNQMDSTVSTVILTCHQDFDFIQEALRLGAIDYIVKTQLEDMDVDQFCGRIVKRVQETLATRSEPAASLDEIAVTWQSVLWLVDDKWLERMTQVYAPAIEEERVWNRLIQEAYTVWQSKLMDNIPDGWMSQLLDLRMPRSQELTAILRSGREDIMQIFRRSGYSEEVIHSVIQASDYIHLHAGRRLSQSEICTFVNLSKSYFSKCFKDIMNMSFVVYLQETNIRYAQKLLRTTNHPIYWIAEQSGFLDEKYFSKIFRTKVGMLPTEYRLTCR